MRKLLRTAGLARIERVLSRLRPAERQVLLMSARGQLRNDEIADRLGMSTEAVQRLLTDALYHLDFELERLERSWWRFW